MAMGVEDKVGELGFAHVGWTIWEVRQVVASGNPDTARRPMHEEAPEFLCSSGKAKYVQRV